MTPFPELDAVLERLVAEVAEILGENLLGAYLTGSFALGAGDMQSDCDFLVVVREQVSAHEERALRRLHDEIPTRPGHWTKHLEGSYAPLADIQTLSAIGRDWLYVDHGHRQMEWSDHCNRPEIRWLLRERGTTLRGPEPQTFAVAIPPDLLRQSAAASIADCIPGMLTWTTFDIAWSQRYAVTALCRMLFTLQRGEVISKPAALEWGMRELAERWRPLIRQAAEDRALPWGDPPRPGSVEETLAFADDAMRHA